MITKVYETKDLMAVVRVTIALEEAWFAYVNAKSHQFRRNHANGIVKAWRNIEKLQSELDFSFHSTEEPQHVRTARAYLSNADGENFVPMFAQI